MIIVNDKFKINPDGMGTYDLIQTIKRTDKEFQSAIEGTKRLGHDPKNVKRETEEIISYNVSLSHCINKMMHILAGDETSKKDMSLSKYIDMLKATKIQIDKKIEKQLNK